MLLWWQQQRPSQQQQPTTPLGPFLKPLFVEPTGGGVCRTWDPPDNHDLREAQLAHQPFVNKVELGVVLRKDAARRTHVPRAKAKDRLSPVLLVNGV